MPFAADSPNEAKHAWLFVIRFLGQAKTLWHCLALHLVVNHAERQMVFMLAIPRLFTLYLRTPILPDWLGGAWLAHGLLERAEYGFWHDYYETKLQWRKIISKVHEGLEWRITRDSCKRPVTRTETLMSSQVQTQGDAWAKAQDFASWGLVFASWSAKSGHWCVPNLYGHCFILKAVKADKDECQMRRHFIRPNQVKLSTVFTVLSQDIEASLKPKA